MITELNERSREIFRHVISAYMESGAPVGSKMLADMTGLNLSPATIRNVLGDLERKELLYAPHTSAGRMPTQKGLRLYVDGLMEIRDLDSETRAQIKAQCTYPGEAANDVFERASGVVSGLSDCLGLVVAPKMDKPLHQIQFVLLEPGKALIILVSRDGMVENRIVDVPRDLDESAMICASNFINDRISGRRIAEARRLISEEIAANKTQLDSLTAELVAQGIALPQDNSSSDGHLIIRGQSRLLEDVNALSDLEHARMLFKALEEQETMMHLLEAAGNGEGVQIYIGTENRLFTHSGWSMALSPCRDADESIVGAIGVIGPNRINYGRIIPVLDYTSQLLSRLVGDNRS